MYIETIKDFNTKKAIIDFLYSKLHLADYRYNMLDNIKKLEQLKETEHYVTINFKGLNVFIIFYKYNNENMCIVIDRKKLSYHKKNIDYKIINFMNIKSFCDNDIYNGTIMTGKLIENKLILIQDCLYLSGESMLDIDMMLKIKMLNSQLRDRFKSKLDFKINNYYIYDELEFLIKDKMKSITIPFNGLLFYPKKSGISMLHIEKTKDKIDISNNEAIKDISFNIIDNYVETLKARKYSYEEGIKKNLYLSKTDIMDVYSVYDDINRPRIGIAHIPNLKTSQMCYDTIGDSPMLFRCVYYKPFLKWIPICKI